MGAPVGAEQAAAAVRGWLKLEGSPLGAPLNWVASQVDTFRNNAGEADYFAVSLVPEGYVILAADDAAEPVVAFSPRGHYDPSPANALAALVNRDLPKRMAEIRASPSPSATSPRCQAKWQRLVGLDSGGPGSSGLDYGPGSISDVRVAPLIQTLWSQSTAYDAGSVACYNYFTPPYAAGNPKNYVCGCVATSAAQLLRYWQHPTAGVGSGAFSIAVDGVAKTAQLLGGDGSGGPYDWANMPALAPGSGNPTLTQCEAIGALTHDVGVAVHMLYAATESGARQADAKTALVSVFKYSNAVVGGQGAFDIGPGLNGMINPNLDARCPVLLGILEESGNGGHSIVCDGYGYDLSTLYHHLNMGWSGSDDVWYALPYIDAAENGYTFDVVDTCIYNVFPNGTGEIISGRVLNSVAAPVAGATVTAARTGGGTYTATTDSKGIYALTNVPSASQYSITASTPTLSPGTTTCSTGTSFDETPVSGNCWGVNLTIGATPAGVDHFTWSAIASPQTANQPFSVSIAAANSANSTVTSFNGTVALSAVAAGATSLFADGFEDGTMNGWTAEGGTYTRSIDTIGANGSARSLSLIGGNSSPYDGVSHSFANLAPDRINFYVRASAANQTCGYFVFGQAEYRTNSVAQFYLHNDGTMGLTTPDGSGWYGAPYAANQWYKISFLLDWSAKTVGYYVNDALVADGIPFCNPGLTGIATLDLYNFDNTQAWWDEIEFIQGAGNAPVPISPATSGSFVNGLWTGSIAVQQAAPNVVLTANDGAGHVGSSAPFDVSSSAVQNPAITGPPPGSTLTSSTVTFQWSGGSGVSAYFLYVGTSIGANDLYAQSEGLNLSARVAGLPVDGATLYVRLWWQTASGWQTVDYTFISGGTAVPSPTISAFSVTPSTVAAGAPLTVSYTVADAGGPGLQRAELWRFSESTGTWTVPQTNSCSGTASVSGLFSETLSAIGSYAYGLHAVDASGDTKAESNFGLGPIWVTVTPGSPALALQSLDIGADTTWNVGGQSVPGIITNQDSTTSVGANGYDVVAGGIDIWNVGDGFRFVYTNLSGDFDLQVRVASLAEADQWSKAGLMARDGTGWDARFFDVITTPAAGVNLCDVQCRVATYSNAVNFSTGTSPFAGTTYPNMWLRLQRTGNVFQGYRSSDGVNWTSLAGTNIGMPSRLCVGLATAAHDYAGAGLTTTAQYRDITISSAPAPTRIIGLSGTLAFGNVTVAGTAQAPMTIANTGNSPLTVSGITYPPGFSGPWSGTVPANGSQQVIVTFAPADAQQYGGNLTVNSDATSGANTLPVSGTGQQPTVALPADTNADFRLVINEVTAYGAAWKRGDIWPDPPNPIPIDYVTRAGYLWKNGECYGYDSSQSPPLCWVAKPCGLVIVVGSWGASANARPHTALVRDVLQTSVANSIAARATAGGAVSLLVQPEASVSAYAAEETLPAGITPYDIEGDGSWDPVARQVKWGPFFDNAARTLSYTVAGNPGTYALSGVGSFDGASVTTAGDRQIAIPGGNAPSPQLTVMGGSNGLFRFLLNGPVGSNYAVQVSADLVNWRPFSTNTVPSSGSVVVADPSTATKLRRFYRAVAGQP